MTLKLVPVLYALGGGLAGYLWYRFVGCKSGTCPLTSNAHITVLYGMLMGFLISKW